MQNLEASLQEIQETLKAEPESTDSPLPPSCAICFLVERSVVSYLTFLFAEFVNDIELRLKFRQARGFCRLHTQAVRTRGDALGIAILYSDLADLTITQWRDHPPTKPSLLSFPKRNRSTSPELPCPACSIEAEANSRYLRALAQGLERVEVREAIKNEPRFCMAHFEEMMRVSKPEIAQFVHSIALQHLENLNAELAEFIRKNDYRFRGEDWGSERDSWQRALNYLTRPPE